MPDSAWFDDLPVIGRMAPEIAAARLRDAGLHDDANAIEAAAPIFAGGGGLRLFQPRPWQHTSHTFGYLAPVKENEAGHALDIAQAGAITPDLRLKNSRVKITLDRLGVIGYPGFGMHQILFDFAAQNQVPGQVEHVHFNAAYRVREGEQAGIMGYPIFIGLNVGEEGIAFRCYTVNVMNQSDEEILQMLDSDVFRSGLKLASTLNPVIAPLSQMALGITRALAQRNRNIPVQDFALGLDFSNVATRARLAEGSYLAVQIPEELEPAWDWREWVYQPTVGQVVKREDPGVRIPYNYLVFSVSRYHER
ncbi:MAG: hypothetical protein ACM3XM_10325 [Mycobacterium leprae]